MKKLASILLGIILGSFLAAQNVSIFNKIYTAILGMPCYSDRINVCSGGYMIYGGTIDSNNLSKVVMMKIDTLGNLLWKKSYGKSGYNFYDESIIPGGGGGVPVPWGGYIEPGSVSNSIASWYKLALYRFDDNGDTLWTKIYNDSTNELGITVKVTRQKKYVIGSEWALYDALSGFRFFTTTLKKTDTLGNIIWQKTYHGLPSHLRESLSLDTCKDGGYIICMYDIDTNNAYHYGGSIFIMKIDSAGIPQWTRYIYDPIWAVAPVYILSLHDGSYIVSGSYVDSANYNGGEEFSKLYLAKISATGSVQWAKQYGYGSWNGACLFSLRELLNGDIISCGVDSSTSVIGCILEIDSNGNQKWLRYYEMQYPAEQDYLLDIQPTSDGGYVSAGATYPGVGGTTQNIWVVKTDSLGVSTGITLLHETVQSEVRVYPNPNNGQFTMSLSNINENCNILIYNVLGEKVYSQSNIVNYPLSINLSSQPQGVYLYRVITENGELVGEGKVIIAH